MDNLIAFLAPLVGFAIPCVLIFSRLKREQRILKTGAPAVALVKNIIKTNMAKYAQGRLFTFGSTVWDVFLQIEEPGKPVRGLNIYYKFDNGFIVPQPGERVNILIDENDADKVLVISKSEIVIT